MLQSLIVLYGTLVQKRMPDLRKTFEFHDTPQFDLLILARKLLVDGETQYAAAALGLAETDANVRQALEAASAKERHQPFRFSFSEESRREIESQVEHSQRGMDLMASVKECMGDLFPEKGIVKAEQYEEANNALHQIEEEVLGEYAKNEDERKMWNEM